MTNLYTILSQRLDETLSVELQTGTRREIRLPGIPGKALAVIGTRRAGKTTFLRQCLKDRLDRGSPRESLILLGLEDDRLPDLDSTHLDWLLVEYYRRYPGFRNQQTVTLCLDEIQLVKGWERFARRIVDTEQIDLFLSGSSAKLLSREVATAFRGRGLEVLVHPFSFREALQHAGQALDRPWQKMDKAERSQLDHDLRRYLVEGGFPEAQGVEPEDRNRLLGSYVDITTLRDVIERHAVSNPLALRWLIRQLLETPGGSFSVAKLYHTIKPQGIPVGKDTLHEYLAHLEDTFLLRTVWLHTNSERRRMVNPRKVYPVDPGLIPLFDRSGRVQTGRALETVVMLELERRGYDLGYIKTEEDWEVDFHASAPQREALLIQVCAYHGEPTTMEREVRALEAARRIYPRARAILLTLETLPPRQALPPGVEWIPAVRWLVEEM